MALVILRIGLSVVAIGVFATIMYKFLTDDIFLNGKPNIF